MHEWIVAEFKGEYEGWQKVAYWPTMLDSDFEEIDERRIERGFNSEYYKEAYQDGLDAANEAHEQWNNPDY